MPNRKRKPTPGVKTRRLFNPGKEPNAVRVTPVISNTVECMRCERRFGYKDIQARLFQYPTQICSRCYVALQDAPYHISCFGKPTVIENGKRILLGYDPKARECSRWCLDRKLCASLFRFSRIIRTPS